MESSVVAVGSFDIFCFWVSRMCLISRRPCSVSTSRSSKTGRADLRIRPSDKVHCVRRRKVTCFGCVALGQLAGNCATGFASAGRPIDFAFAFRQRKKAEEE